MRTEPSTIVRRLLGDETVVQCSHHQAVDALGESLLVSARSDDGVIEAVEVLGRTFAVGVQWHPEEHGDVRLFAGLVEAARAARAVQAAGPGATEARGSSGRDHPWHHRPPPTDKEFPCPT